MFFFSQLFYIAIGFILGFYFNSYGFELIDQLILFKIRINKKINECLDFSVKNKCEILECILINEDHFFKNDTLNTIIKVKDVIDKDTFIDIFYHFQLEINEDSGLMIRYTYNNKINRIYIHYKQVKDGYILKLPIDIENYKKKGLDNIAEGKKFNFQNEFNEISQATINDIDILEEINEMNGINNDFGLLNNNKIIIKYLKKEFNLDKIDQLKIKYKNFHLDDEKMELIDHEIIKKQDHECIESEILLRCIKK